MSRADCQVLVLVPFKAEAKLLAAILPDCRQSDSHSWNFADGRLACANSAGGEALLKMLSQELAKASYNRIILFGAAGALAPDLEIGQVFYCNRLLNGDRSIEMPVLPDLPAAVTLTVNEPVTSADEHKQHFAQYGATLVDMESFYFAEALADRDLAGAIIRFVSDTERQPFVLPFPDSIKKGITGCRRQIINSLFT